ncbi:hypothetical protein ACP4OV_004457 [Aristida adscensionis]
MCLLTHLSISSLSLVLSHLIEARRWPADLARRCQVARKLTGGHRRVAGGAHAPASGLVAELVWLATDLAPLAAELVRRRRSSQQISPDWPQSSCSRSSKLVWGVNGSRAAAGDGARGGSKSRGGDKAHVGNRSRGDQRGSVAANLMAGGGCCRR